MARSRLLRQFLLWFSLLVVLPSLVLAVHAYLSVRRYAYEEVRTGLAFDLEKSRASGDALLSDCAGVLQRIATDEGISEMLLQMREAMRRQDRLSLSYTGYFSLKPELTTLLRNESWIDNVLLVIDGECVYAHTGTISPDMPSPFAVTGDVSVRFQGFLESPFGLPGTYVSASRDVLSTRGTDTSPVGTLVLLIRASDAAFPLSRFLRYEDSMLVLTGEDTVAATTDRETADLLLDEFLLPAGSGQDMEIVFRNSLYNVSTLPSAFSGLRYVLFTPMTHTLSVIQPVLRLGISWLFLMALALFLFAMLYTRLVVHPVVRLSDAMRGVTEGDLSRQVQLPVAHNELREVCEGFNGMTVSLQQLMERIRQEEQSKRHYQLAMLKYQINPHFLYNTINSIRFSSIRHGDRETAGMLVTLSRLLRHTLSNTEAMVPFPYELSNLEDYMSLMCLRYNGLLRFDRSAAEVPDDALVPMTTLQPIMENAIIHGLSERLNRGEEATVRLEGAIQHSGREHPDLLLTVADGGSGMEESQLATLLTRTTPDSSRHIGLANIHHRIQLLFGEPYGLSIQSRPGEGTCVHVLLPYLTRQIQVPELDNPTEDTIQGGNPHG